MILALKVLQGEDSEISLSSIGGKFREFPLATVGLLVGIFSSAGLPLLLLSHRG